MTASPSQLGASTTTLRGSDIGLGVRAVVRLIVHGIRGCSMWPLAPSSVHPEPVVGILADLFFNHTSTLLSDSLHVRVTIARERNLYWGTVAKTITAFGKR